MTVDLPRLAVNKKLILTNDAMLLVQLALNDNPTVEERQELEEDLSDLEMTKAELVARRNAINSGQTGGIAAPSQAAIDAVSALIAKVEQANLEGRTVAARMALANQAMTTLLTLTA